MNATRWLWWFAALALTACLLPWVVAPGAGLSLNPADLAEWTSLAPGVQAQTPPLLTTFLLRMPLLIVALLMALAANRSRGWAALLILLLAAAQLPPFEFLADGGNANYRQQALMALLTAVFGWLVLFRWPRRFTEAGAGAVAAAGLLAAVLGVSSAMAEMRALGLTVQVGPGALVYGAALTTVVVVVLRNGIKKRRTLAPPLSTMQTNAP